MGQTRRRYTEQEDIYLKENYGKIPILDICKDLKRKRKSIICRAYFLCLTKNKMKSWNSNDIDKVNDLIYSGLSQKCVAKIMNRTVSSINSFCARNKIAKTKHGLSKTRIYSVYQDMKYRCHGPAHKKDYKYYGGKGIVVCEEWKNDFMLFYSWAMNNGYSDDLTIDRIDNNKNYCPENCRWISMIEQHKNTTKIILMTAWEETKCIADWEKDNRCLVCRTTILKRINRGWSAEEALTTVPHSKVFCQ